METRETDTRPVRIAVDGKALRMEDIVEAFLSYMRRRVVPFSAWYAGITTECEKALFDEHSVPRDDHPCICQEALSASEARRAKAQLLLEGCSGDRYAGDPSAMFVYVYLKMPGITRE